MDLQAEYQAKDPPLRVRKKLRVREELVRVAMEFFARKGFEATTVEEIARAAEVSRRTFFRYFPAKELLMFPHQALYFARFRRLLEETRPGETAFDAIRRALTEMAAEFMRSRAEHLEQQRIIRRSAVLIARGDAFDEQWEAAIAARLAGENSGSSVAQRHARLLAGAVLGLIRTTLNEWYTDECRHDLVRMGREALALIEPAICCEPGSLRSRKRQRIPS